MIGLPDALWPVLTVAIPLVTGVMLAVAAWARRPPPEAMVRPIAVLAALLTAAGAALTVYVDGAVDVSWIPALGVRLDLSTDGISAPLLLLTGVVGVVATGLRYHEPEQDHRPGSTAPFAVGAGPSGPALAGYYACLLVVTGAAMLVFLTRDALVFFIAFELVLLPMWVLIRQHGDATAAADRDGAAARFLLFTAAGSTLMAVGILALATSTGTTDLDAWAAGAGAALPPGLQLAIAALMLIGLAVKVPVWPLHTWLPWVHATAPTAGSVLLAAVLLKMGVYGMVRLVQAPLPDGFGAAAPVLAGAAVAGILWAGLACLVERDLKRLIAWSSIAHLGFVVLAMAAGTQTGLQAAVFGNVAHGLISTLLFVVVGHLKHQWGSADLNTARAALREVTPRLGFALVVGMAASMGLPGLAGFWGEFGAIYAALDPAPDRTSGWFLFFGIAAAIGAVLAAVYAVRVLREVWSGDRRAPVIGDLRSVHAGMVAVLAAAIVALGVYPGPLLEMTEPAVALILGGGR